MITERFTQAEFGIWLGQQRASDPSVYNACECLLLQGKLDYSRFLRALGVTLAGFPWLCARFVDGPDGPRRLGPEGPLSQEGSCEFIDLRDQDDPRRALVKLCDAWVRSPLDWAGPLFRHGIVRLGEERFAWIHLAHHLLLDGYGFHLVARRLAEVYGALERGTETSVARGGFAELIEADEAYQASSERALDAAYWSRELERASGIVWGPLGRSSLAHARRSRYVLEKSALLSASSQQNPLDVLSALVARAIRRKTGETCFQLGVPVMLRLGTKAVSVPCMAMNIVPLLVDMGRRGDPSVSELAHSIAEGRKAGRRHERFRYEHMRSLSAPGAKLFGPTVNFLPFEPGLGLGSLWAERLPISAGPVEDLSFALSPRAQNFELIVDAHPDVFSDAEIEGWVSQIQADAVHLGAPRTGSPEGSSTLDRDARDPLARFLLRAREAPVAIALDDEGARLTYGELVQAARGVQKWLGARGVEAWSGAPLALDLSRGMAAIAFVIGAVLHGVPYVAFDRNHPAERYAAIAHRASPCLLVTDRPQAELDFIGAHVRVEAAPELGELLRLGREREAAPSTVERGGVAYIIFTSGSTGEPKGVCVERGALAHFIDSASRCYGFEPGDRVLQFAPLSFDASVEEIFVTLSSGATLCLRSQRMDESLSVFARAVAENRITVLDLPTAFFHEWSIGLEASGLEVPACVRLVIIGGEAALFARVAAFRARAPDLQLLNTYGPTEATVVATYARLDLLEADQELPIGLPLPGIEAHVLDERGCPQIGPAYGELALCGPTLAKGYLHDPVQTAERFVHYSGLGRVYLTRDKVRRASDGTLYFEGRVDDEFKVSGYRVVPAEIERILATHPLVAQVVVFGAVSSSGERTIVAHIEPVLEAEELRAFLRKKLPAALIPSRLCFHAQLPRSPQGKLDRAQLRALESASSRRPIMDGPLSKVLAVWEVILGRSGLGPDDDFFVVGGSSLQVLQLTNRLSGARELRAQDIFAHPTARAQAALIATGARDPAAKWPELYRRDLDFREGELEPHARRRAPIRRVLLTGALGVVGRELCRALLLETSLDVICVVRSRAGLSATERLSRVLSSMDLSWETFSGRIRVVDGDLSELGTLRPLLATLGPFEIVIHSAARVSLNRDYQSLVRENVEATRELILAANAAGAEFHHISTVAVAPLASQVPEQFFELHEGLCDGYQQSKWHAEELCAQAGRLGQSAAVYRLARVSGPRRAPTVEPSDLFWRIARASVRAGVWPDLDVTEIWTPADVVASSLLQLILRGSATAPASVYQLTFGEEISWASVRKRLDDQGVALRVVPLSEWIATASRSADEEDEATLAFFTLREASGSSSLQAHFLTERCLSLLQQEPTSIDAELVDSYCRAFLRLANMKMQ